ncbi:thiol-disulfide oxidoreductase DCC family protein [Virgibacillus sp. W0181]|uniref:thiol-disulfide oxidoreductase DCC family protein n=1 Tax=Virgibacillus sp. W0181 TaxID=3391581 RepID=UPI003F45AFF6
MLFDGDCSFCNRSVKFIIKRDSQEFFKFASLDSDIGKKYKRQFNIPEHMDSMILIVENNWYAKSSAALRISKHLTGLWKMAYILLIIPKPVRDSAYNIIASNRHRFFDQNKSCELPGEDIKKRFL